MGIPAILADVSDAGVSDAGASDVVEQGREDPHRPGGLPPWARRIALAAVALLAAVLIPSGLLSSEAPEPPDRTPAPTRTSVTEGPPVDAEVLVRDGRQIVGYDRFGVALGPVLPRGFSEGTELHVVDNNRGVPAAVFGVVGGRLLSFQVGAVTRTDLGAATRVVDVSTRPGVLFVQTAAADGARVVSLDASSGQVVERAPFSGYDGSPQWTPFGVLSLFGVDGLLLRRQHADGPQDRADGLAVAWATAEVDAGRRPAFQDLGRPGLLLGRTDEHVLLLAGRCPGPGCTLQVLSLGRDRSSIRAVAPPDGWSFSSSTSASSTSSAPGAGGRIRGPLVPVVRIGADGGEEALVRVAAGGDRGLLLAGSAGVVPAAGLVQQADGAVYFVRLAPDGIRRVMVWNPALPGQVSSLDPLPPLSDTARLVCVCT